jgi:hypothetical protein
MEAPSLVCIGCRSLAGGADGSTGRNFAMQVGSYGVAANGARELLDGTPLLI